MTFTFHPYIRMIYDTDRPFSDFENLLRTHLQFLPTELYDSNLFLDKETQPHERCETIYREGISSGIASRIKDEHLSHVFKSCLNARKTTTNQFPDIVVSDVLMKYPDNIKEIFNENERKGIVSFDLCERKSPDHVTKRGGQAYLNIAIGPLPDLRCSYLKGEENLRKKMIENMDKTVESAVREYVSHLKENGVSVKVGSGNSNLYQIVKDAF
ncbi:hypothetical protein J4456_04065 [Candidatus Pacearchaeota archaeon]|nr:hypothetical protein [Candidatus Pacearchaeota archaeon]